MKVTFDKDTTDLIRKLADSHTERIKNNPYDAIKNLNTDTKTAQRGDLIISPEGKEKFIRDLKKDKEAVLKAQKAWFKKYDMKIKGLHLEQTPRGTITVID